MNQLKMYKQENIALCNTSDILIMRRCTHEKLCSNEDE